MHVDADIPSAGPNPRLFPKAKALHVTLTEGDPREMFKTEQEEFWAGEFGDQYVDRNQGAQLLASNIHFFSRALKCAGKVSSAIEFGANVGMNMLSMKALHPSASLQAVEINPKAAKQLATVIGEENITIGSILDYEPETPADLTFTKGVLIHIAPGELSTVYRKLYEYSRRFILIGEYYNPSPVEIPYRGHEGRMFKRDFCGEILEAYPNLVLLDYGFAYRRDPAHPQDDITWFLMEKRS